MKLKSVKVSDLGRIVTGKTPSTRVEDNFNGNIPFITPVDMVGNRHVVYTERHVSEKGAQSVKGSVLPVKSVCVSCIGSDMGKSVITTERSVTNQQINSIIVNENFDYRYVYYLMRTLEVTIKSLGKNGTAVPILSKSKFSDIEVNIHDLECQQRIANILSIYDDLIENNQKQIKLLEEAAQRLYKEWFVDLRFPGQESTKIVDGVPEEWRKVELSEIASVNKQSISKNYSYNFIDYIDLGSVRNGYIESSTRFSLDEAPGRAKRIASDGDIIWGMVRPNLKSYALIMNPKNTNIFSTGFAILTAEKAPFSFLYCCVTQEDYVRYLVNCTNGAAYPAVKPSHFEASIVLLPTDEILEQFDLLAEPLYRKIEILKRQINNLKEARDRLLPKLMSGELEV